MAGAKTIMELIAASGGSLDLSRMGQEDTEGGGEEEEFLWGCSSKEEEHDQLVSYVSLGWFDPTARLQVRGPRRKYNTFSNFLQQS